jgi:hypothetical protein
LAGQLPDAPQYGFCLNGHSISTRKDVRLVRLVAKTNTVLELRACDLRQVFPLTKNGKVKRKRLWLPRETTIANLYTYWNNRLRLHISLRVTEEKINRYAVIPFADCHLDGFVINTITKEPKYFFQFPGGGTISTRLPHTETVKSFKQRLVI